MTWKDILKADIDEKELDLFLNRHIFHASDYTLAMAVRMERLLEYKFEGILGVEVEYVDSAFYIDFFNIDEEGDYEDKDKAATYKFDRKGNLSRL